MATLTRLFNGLLITRHQFASHTQQCLGAMTQHLTYTKEGLLLLRSADYDIPVDLPDCLRAWTAESRCPRKRGHGAESDSVYDDGDAALRYLQ